MNMNIKDRIILNDNIEYLVISKIIYQSNIYYLLTNINDIKNIKICQEKNRKNLIEIEDKNFISKLLPYFVKSSFQYIKNSNLL